MWDCFPKRSRSSSKPWTSTTIDPPKAIAYRKLEPNHRKWRSLCPIRCLPPPPLERIIMLLSEALEKVPKKCKFWTSINVVSAKKFKIGCKKLKSDYIFKLKSSQTTNFCFQSSRKVSGCKKRKYKRPYWFNEIEMNLFLYWQHNTPVHQPENKNMPLLGISGFKTKDILPKKTKLFSSVILQKKTSNLCQCGIVTLLGGNHVPFTKGKQSIFGGLRFFYLKTFLNLAQCPPLNLRNIEKIKITLKKPK